VLLQNRKFLLGISVILLFVILGLAGVFLTTPEMRRTGAYDVRLPPGREALLGTDSMGRSISVQLSEALLNSLQVGLLAAAFGTVVGALVGFASGYFGRAVDSLLRIVIDTFLSVPSLVFLILIASLVRAVSVQAIALIIGAFAWASPARQSRAQVLSLKERAFVKLSRLSGMGGPEIILRELIPNMFQWLGANFVNAFLAAVLAEAGLSLLGLGPQKEMTLGMMLYWALSYGAILQNMWWWWLLPVFTLMLLFLSLYLVHLGLDEVSNPRMARA
jgi:peptide/nickel transport system permease protein